MLRPRKLGHRRWLGCGHIAKRIKKLDRQLQFFVKKLAHVRHSRAATAQENALGRISLLLPPIMADGTHQFPVQSSHCAAYDLRNAGNIRVCRLRVHASQAHKAVALLTRFCCCEWLAKFPGNRDRKSTRLNSSHSQISYAVFCLKKKKNNTIPNKSLNTD